MRFIEVLCFIMGYPRVYLEGKVFKYLTVIRNLGIHNHKTIWECKCVCGNIRNVASGELSSGNCISCGCLHARGKHNMHDSGIYSSWVCMKQRCLNPNQKSFKNYGGRGITVHPAWLQFINFYKDMGKNYIEGLTIERIDSNGNYEPGNCKWIPLKDQPLNTRKTIWVDSEWGHITLVEASKLSNINLKTLYKRFCRGLRNEYLFKPVNPIYYASRRS